MILLLLVFFFDLPSVRERERCWPSTVGRNYIYIYEIDIMTSYIYVSACVYTCVSGYANDSNNFEWPGHYIMIRGTGRPVGVFYFFFTSIRAPCSDRLNDVRRL